MEFFKELKGFDIFPHQPSLKFIFFVGFWNNEGIGFIFPILQKRKLIFSAEKLSDLHKQDMPEAKKIQMYQLFHSGALTTSWHSLRNITPWI
jgi:hypothetical protein